MKAANGALRPGPVSLRLFVACLVANLMVRGFLALLPGYSMDMRDYKRWAMAIATTGLGSVYETTKVDYPPLFLYALWPVGKLYLAVGLRDAGGDLADSRRWTALIKLPHVVFDLLLAWMLAHLVGHRNMWGAVRAGPGWGRLAALLYLWNPAVLWGSGFWGQPDGGHSLLALAAFAALGGDRFLVAGALMAAAGLMKPLAAPLVPTLIVVAAVRGGVRGVVQAAAAGLATACVVLLPFIVRGDGATVARRLVVDLNAMPFSSLNAHNLWWLVGGWQPADVPRLAGFTFQTVGLCLFLVAGGFLLWRARSWLAAGGDATTRAAGVMVLGAAAATSFFFLTTHMHENHMFMALAFLLAVAGRTPALGRLALAASVAVFANMVLHHPPVGRPGGIFGWPSPVFDPLFHRPFTWLQMVGSYLNTALVAIVAAGTYAVAWRWPRSRRE
jgi:Gpi18-like mannosyltransferase